MDILEEVLGQLAQQKKDKKGAAAGKGGSPKPGEEQKPAEEEEGADEQEAGEEATGTDGSETPHGRKTGNEYGDEFRKKRAKGA